MIPFNFHHLFYFYNIAKTGSVSETARKLRISQPALSAQIKQFEKFLGISLFERRGRKLVLTEAGHSALSYANIIFDSGQEFIDGLRDKSQKGVLKIQIGVANSVPKTFAAAVLKFIFGSGFKAQVLLHEDTLGNMTQGVRDHALDMVLSDLPVETAAGEGLQNILLGSSPVGFYVRSSLAGKFKGFPRCLNGAPLILPTAQSRISQAVQEFLARRQLTPQVIAEIQDVELIHRMALDGIGIAPLNRYSVTQSPFSGQLTILDKRPSHQIQDTLYLIRKARQKPHPLVEHLANQFTLKL